MGSWRSATTPSERFFEITDKRQASRPLFKALPSEKRRELKHRLMREDRAFTEWPEALGVEVDSLTLLEVMERMLIETGSVVLRPGMADIWARLRGDLLRLANLASDYVTVLQTRFPTPWTWRCCPARLMRSSRGLRSTQRFWTA